jgi:uncharacterized protein
MESQPEVIHYPATEKQPFWDYEDLAILVGFVFAAVVALVLISSLILAALPSLRSNPAALGFVTQLLLYGFIYAGFRFNFSTRYGQPVFRSLGWQTPQIPLLAAVLAGLILPFVLSALAGALHPPAIPSPFDKYLKSPVWLVLLGILAVTLGPLVEELFFRGFLQPLLCRSLGVVAGIFATAAAFGVLHGPEYSWSWQFLVSLTLAGAAFGWMRWASNSVISATVMHGCFNLVMFAAMIYKLHLKP